MSIINNKNNKFFNVNNVKDDKKMNTSNTVPNTGQVKKPELFSDADQKSTVGGASNSFAASNVNKGHTPAQFNENIDDFFALASDGLSRAAKETKCAAIAARSSDDQKKIAQIKVQLFNLFDIDNSRSH